MKANKKPIGIILQLTEEEAASRHEYPTLYLILRRLSGKTKLINDNIKKINGNFMNPLVNACWGKKNSSNNYTTTICTRDIEPTINDVRSVIRSLKIRKVLGVDQLVTAEIIKAGGEILLQWFHVLLTHIWRLEHIPLHGRKTSLCQF